MDKLERDGFCFCFVVGPVLFAGIIPTMIFGLFFDQAGSNLLWGTYFGLG